MNICVVIPVHNEVKSIGSLVESIKRKKFDVVVIDDGSTDDSHSVAQEKGAIVLKNETKHGKGMSLQKGFEYAIAHQYEGVITMDGDGQHDGEDIDKFIKAIPKDPKSIITGNRMGDPAGMPRSRYFTNWFMSRLISWLCKQRIPDTQCGFRYIGCDILKNCHFLTKDFEIESEVLIKASKKGYKIYSVPVKSIYQNEESKIHPFKDTFRFITYLFKEWKNT